MAVLDAARADAATPSRSAAPYGRRSGQPARRARALSRVLALSHPRLERTRDDWTGGVVRLLPAHQRGRDRPLRARTGRRDGDRAVIGLRAGGGFPHAALLN